VRQELPELGPGKGSQTSRGVKRRDLILKVAATLFAENGFDSVSISDIGIAAGITGPAIYRYFVSKEALLVSIYDHLYKRFSKGITAILRREVSAVDSLEMLLEFQVDLAYEDHEKIRIVDNDGRHLTAKEAADFRVEHRRPLSVWIDLLGQARPDLTRIECEVTVHAVLALINSISLRRGAPDAGIRFQTGAALAADSANHRCPQSSRPRRPGSPSGPTLWRLEGRRPRAQCLTR
jgi:AcrR family transcriptional regulator